jgi:hypothetical protein
MVGREIPAGDHPKKDVRRALSRLTDEGWTLHKEGHWGRLYCPCACTTIPVPGTPGNSSAAASRIHRAAGRCPLPEGDPRRVRRA